MTETQAPLFPEPAPTTGKIQPGETTQDKLSILQAWLAEDSDLPQSEVDDFVAALGDAIDRLNAEPKP